MTRALLLLVLPMAGCTLLFPFTDSDGACLPAGAGEHEPNDDAAHADVLCTPNQTVVATFLAGAYSEDWYRITLGPDDSQLHVFTSPAGGSGSCGLDTVVRVYADPTGEISEWPVMCPCDDGCDTNGCQFEDAAVACQDECDCAEPCDGSECDGHLGGCSMIPVFQAAPGATYYVRVVEFCHGNDTSSSGYVLNVHAF